MKNEEVNK